MSFSTLNADVEIIINAKDNASEAVSDAAKRITASWRDMNRQNSALGRAFEIQHRQLFQVARGIQTVGSIANRVVNVWQAYNIMQIRNIERARDLREALDKQKEALVQFGPASEEFKRATEDLTILQKQAGDQGFETAFSFVFMGTSIVGSMIPAIRKALPVIRSLRTAILGVRAATLATAGTVAGLIALATAAADISVETITGKSPIKSLAAQYGVDIPSPLEAIKKAVGIPSGAGTDKPIDPKLAAIISGGGGAVISQIFNFYSTTSQELVKDVEKAAKTGTTFGP